MDSYNFRIVNLHGLKGRGYISFYLDGKRIREYNGNNLLLSIHPNRATSEKEKNRLFKRLLMELKKAIKEDNYPVISSNPLPRQSKGTDKPVDFHQTEYLLEKSINRKLHSNLSFYYKKNLKAVHSYFINFLTKEELKGDIRELKQSRIQEFLDNYSSSGANYMNRRRELGVLLSSIQMDTGVHLNFIRNTHTIKRTAKLHKIYEKDQMIKIFSFLEQKHANLHLCCLICYGCFLRPHQEIRNLKVGHIKKDCSEIHLSGEENKSGRIRIVYIPEFVKKFLSKRIEGLEEWQNIFTVSKTAFNRTYFHTQWQRLKPIMIAENLLQPLQTLYSFRHSAAVNVYRKTKDLDIIKKLMGHSDMIVTLKYLRSLGEYNDEGLREHMPDL
jgi:integrase